jgi:Coenzyme PQQ synthesis protein D (PqqD)
MTTYRRSQDVVCRQVGGESILVPIRHNVGNLDYVYTLSPVAARIWALLDGSRSVEAIAEELCGEFEVDSDTAAADVTALLADLASASLISEVR